MTIDQATERPELTVLENLRGTRDALSVRRVFGDPFTADGVTVIPVARVTGAGGGGGGKGTGPDDEGGHGFGTGFRLGARPVGVYEIREGDLAWKPAIDADRLARSSQVLVALVTICATMLIIRRR